MENFICQLYETELGIPMNNVYVTYHGVNDCGWREAVNINKEK